MNIMMKLFIFFFFWSDDMIEKNSGIVKLHDIDPSALRQLIEYVYTGDIPINEDNVQVFEITYPYFPHNLLCTICISSET